MGEPLRDNIPYETHYRLTFARGPFRAHKHPDADIAAHFPDMNAIKIAYGMNHPLRQFVTGFPSKDDAESWAASRKLTASMLTEHSEFSRIPELHLLSLKMRNVTEGMHYFRSDLIA